MIPFLLVVASLVGLIFTADILVNGSVAIAYRLKIPKIIVGLTIVSFGTSLPEIMVSVSAILNNDSGMAIGNIVGSNIGNILLVIGSAAVIAPINVKAHDYKTSTYLMMFATILFSMVAIFLHVIDFKVSLFFLCILLGYIFIISKSDPEKIEHDIEEFENSFIEKFFIKLFSFIPSMFIIIVLTALSMVILPIFSSLLVTNASILASIFGVSSTFIGITILALGTSLPELVTSIVAARKGHCDIALSNVLGSNFFNLIAVTGISGMFGNIIFPERSIMIDIPFMFMITLIFALLLIFAKYLTRLIGLIFLLSYVSYITFIYFF